MPIVTGKQLKIAIRGKYDNTEEAASLLGVSRQTLSGYFGRAELNDEVLQNVKDKLGIELKGVDLNVKSIISDKEKVVNIGTPVYADPASGSAVELYTDIQDLEPSFFVNIPQFKDCDFGKVIYGHSMSPTYEQGSYCFMKRQVGTTIMFGEVYYIETGDLKMVKRLQRGDKDDELIAESDNYETRPDGRRRYEPFPVRKEEILKLYLVKGSFKQNQN